jgi:hypothetical protein
MKILILLAAGLLATPVFAATKPYEDWNTNERILTIADKEKHQFTQEECVSAYELSKKKYQSETHELTSEEYGDYLNESVHNKFGKPAGITGTKEWWWGNLIGYYVRALEKGNIVDPNATQEAKGEKPVTTADTIDYDSFTGTGEAQKAAYEKGWNDYNNDHQFTVPDTENSVQSEALGHHPAGSTGRYYLQGYLAS